MMVQRAVQGALHKRPHNFGPVALEHRFQLGLLTAQQNYHKGLSTELSHRWTPCVQLGCSNLMTAFPDAVDSSATVI